MHFHGTRLFESVGPTQVTMVADTMVLVHEWTWLMNGPDIEAVDEVKALILESVKAWKNNKDAVKEHCSFNPREQKRTGPE